MSIYAPSLLLLTALLDTFLASVVYGQGTAGSTAHWALKKEKEEAKAQKKIRGKAIPTAPGAIIPISNPADAKESKTTLKNRLKASPSLPCDPT